MAISKEILQIICCPKDKSNLRYDIKKNKLICVKCKKAYNVEGDVPILLTNDN